MFIWYFIVKDIYYNKNFCVYIFFGLYYFKGGYYLILIINLCKIEFFFIILKEYVLIMK